MARLRCAAGERQQGYVAGLLDGRGQAMLVRRTNSGQTPGDDFAALGDELAEQAVIFVIDVGDFFGAELADFLAPEKFASALARRTAGAGTSAPAASSKTRAVTAAGTLAKGPRWAVGYGRWCFCFVSHNAPWKTVASGSCQWPAKICTASLPELLDAYAVAGVSCAGAAGASSAAAGWALTFFLASRSFLIFSRRFCSSSMRTVMNLITGSVTRRRRSSSCTTEPTPSIVIKI